MFNKIFWCMNNARYRIFFIIISCFSLSAFNQEHVHQLNNDDTKPSPYGKYCVKTNKLWTPSHLKMNFGGVIGDRLRVNLENWELTAPEANPAMLEMFYDRDRLPSRNLLMWSGEFVGKYLCASILSYRMLDDPRQKKLIEEVAEKLMESQGEDGYLGPYDLKNRLTGKKLWDLWGHYWAISALSLYYDEFKEQKALNVAMKAADMIVTKFLNEDFHFTGASNYAVIHAFTQLYMLTGKSSYLETAKWIIKKWDLPGSNQYMSKALNGYEMYQFPNKGTRWESVHSFLGMYDMYLLTGESQYYDAFTHIWYSIQRGDRHNTGGFTTGEVATGNPYLQGPIETCCTVAWIDMSINMLKLTGNSLIADELELSTYNGLLGAQHPSGRWWTYDTPMDGTKEASAHTVNFQCRPGSPELNCCSVNGPRGLTLLSEWAVLRTENSVAVNFYGQSTFNLQTPGDKRLTIIQKTDYPHSGNISMQLALSVREQFLLQLRIPSWSSKTIVKVNGQLTDGVTAGSYLDITRKWKTGDRIEVFFDMSPHYWLGDKEMMGKTSIYYGPLLLAFDPVYNKLDPDQIPEMNAHNLKLVPSTTGRRIQPWVLFSVKSEDGSNLLLCDFATAGAYGNKYLSWLPVKGVAKIRNNSNAPIWVNRELIDQPKK